MSTTKIVQRKNQIVSNNAKSTTAVADHKKIAYL
jgi:hypothetical protein